MKRNICELYQLHVPNQV